MGDKDWKITDFFMMMNIGFLSTTHDTGIPKKMLGKIKNANQENKIELDNLLTLTHECKNGEKKLASPDN